MRDAHHDRSSVPGRPDWRRSSPRPSPCSRPPVPEPKSKTRGKHPARHPADYSIVESDLAGSYFVARPLKEKYDNLVQRVGELRTEIDEARIDEPGARRELDRLQTEIDEAIRAIDKAKLYVPGATVQNRAATRSIPLGPDDLLLVDAEDVEIRRGDGPDVQCVVKKTVLGEIDKEQDLTPEFAGIELVVRKILGPREVRLLQGRRRPARAPSRIRPVPLQAVPRSRSSPWFPSRA